MAGEVFDYLVAHGRMKEKEARAKFRQVLYCSITYNTEILISLIGDTGDIHFTPVGVIQFLFLLQLA